MTRAVHIYVMGMRWKGDRLAFASHDHRWLPEIKTLLHDGFRIVGLGCENGAMAVHFGAKA